MRSGHPDRSAAILSTGPSVGVNPVHVQIHRGVLQVRRSILLEGLTGPDVAGIAAETPDQLVVAAVAW